jgi:hypothetical protein
VPTSRSGIEYHYVDGGTSEEDALTSQTYTLTVSCAWVNRFVLKADLLGWARIDANNALRRIMPMGHPDVDNMWATGVRLVKPVGVLAEVETGQPGYRFRDAGRALTREGKAWLGVSYISTPYDIKADGTVNGEWERWTIRRLKGSTESQRILGGTWRWKGTGPPGLLDEKTLRADMSLPYQITAVEWHWLALPQLPPNRLLATNRVNATPFQEFDTGTLLFGPHVEEPVQLPDRTRGWNVTYNAVYRPNTWNRFWRQTNPVGAGGPGFYELEAKTATAGVRRSPYLGYEFRNCWSFVPDAGGAVGF